MNKFRYIFLFLIILSFNPNLIAQTHKIRIKFIDKENHKRVPFVAISESKGDVFLGSANKKGIFKIETYLKVDSLICSAIGYETYVFSINDLKKNIKIYLKPNVQHLEEIVVKGFSLDYLLKTTFKKHLDNIKLRSQFNFCEYLKTHKINDKYVEMLHSNGFLYYDAPRIYNKRRWDNLFIWKYSPINTKLSNAYLNGFSNDTLRSRKFSKKYDNFSYKFSSVSSNLKELYRTIQIFGPINKKYFSYYKYTLDSIYTHGDKNIYRVHFRSLNKKFPKKFKIQCSGHLYINRDNYTVSKIKFDQINYYNYYTFTYNFRKGIKIKQPFNAKASISYRCINNAIFLSDIKLTKDYFHSIFLNTNINYSGIQMAHDRPYNNKDKYIVYESLIFHKYIKDENRILTNEQLTAIKKCISFGNNPKIFYNPITFISSKNIISDMKKLINDLGKHQDLEKQFNLHRNMYFEACTIKDNNNNRDIFENRIDRTKPSFKTWSEICLKLFDNY